MHNAHLQAQISVDSPSAEIASKIMSVNPAISFTFDIPGCCGLTRTLGAGTAGCGNAGKGKGVLGLVQLIAMWLAYK